jgi:HD superfamily phosphohydrolase
MKPVKSTDPDLTEEYLCIPSDLLVDIFGIVVKESIIHEVTQVIENRSLLYLSLYINHSNIRHQQLLHNIQNLLQEYKEYRWEESEQLNWRTS